MKFMTCHALNIFRGLFAGILICIPAITGMDMDTFTGTWYQVPGTIFTLYDMFEAPVHNGISDYGI